MDKGTQQNVLAILKELKKQGEFLAHTNHIYYSSAENTLFFILGVGGWGKGSPQEQLESILKPIVEQFGYEYADFGEFEDGGMYGDSVFSQEESNRIDHILMDAEEAGKLSPAEEVIV